MQKDKPQLFYELNRYNEHGYENTGITIQTGKVSSLDSLIADCANNKIGYYDNGDSTGLEIAARMSRKYEWLREQGFTGIHQWNHYETDAYLRLEWQHGRECEGYCEMSIVYSPRKFRALDASAKLLSSLVASGTRKRSSYVFLHDPAYMLEVLKRRGAIAVETWRYPEYLAKHGDSELCYRKSGSNVVKVAS